VCMRRANCGGTWPRFEAQAMEAWVIAVRGSRLRGMLRSSDKPWNIAADGRGGEGGEELGGAWLS
jgi:hypothetical protein